MIETEIKLFSKLKRQRSMMLKNSHGGPIFFQINFDNIGAYLKVVDKNGQKQEPVFEYYSGVTRKILKALDDLSQKNSFRIDWETTSDRFYLAENSFLLNWLARCDNFVDEELKLIQPSKESAELIIDITEENENFIIFKVMLLSQNQSTSNFQIINQDHVLADQKLFKINNIGSNYKEIQLFNAKIPQKDLEKCLSLLFSVIDEISIHYRNYKVINAGPVQTRPTLIFEQVDPDHSLYLRVSHSLPELDANFLDNFEVIKAATVNDLKQKIMVSDIINTELIKNFNEIKRLLKKNQKGLKSENGFFVEDNLFIIEAALADKFIHGELGNLISHFAFLGAEKIEPFKVKAVTPKLNLQLSHGLDFLEGEATLEIEGQQIHLFDVLNQYNKNSYIALNDNVHAIINPDYIKKLQRIFKGRKTKVKISFFDLPIVEELIDEKVAQKTFQHSREIFLGFNKLKSKRMKYPKLKTNLRKYQKQGYKWIDYLHKHKLGGCLADDMGLGKTVQAISLLASIYPAQNLGSLIIMPKSLLFNWENEINKFKPELSYYIYHGTKRNLKDALSKNLIFTTYATVRNDIQLLTEETFYYVILDESQQIKNINSRISKAVMLLNAKHRLALSGTPIENHLGELYALFRFLNPAMFGSIRDFNKNYLSPIQKEDDKGAANELKKKIYPFILRRLKQEVLKDLPAKIEQTLFVEMSSDQKIFYEQRRLFYQQAVKKQIITNGINKSHFFILQALGELRQIAAIPESKSENTIISPKRQVLLEHIQEVVANEHKVLVFANYLHALDCIANDLNKAGIDHLLMTGATRNRKQLVENFQNNDQYKIFLMTLKTGGLGLNLTAADYIFIFDPWWNRSAENQAIDRSHRIGQDKTVFSYRMITKGTIEEKMLKLQEIKKELFDNLITSDGASIKTLDEKDVEFVLGE